MLRKIFIFCLSFFVLFQLNHGNSVFGIEEGIQNKILQNNSSSPNFQISFQRPSYLLEANNSKKIIYICDNSKDECRVNLNLVKVENGKALSSILSCKISTTFESDQFERCNPNTVVFGKGIHPVSIKVHEKKNPGNFSLYNFLIINGEVDNNLLKIEENKIKEILSEESNKDQIDKIQKQIYSGELVIREYYSEEVRIMEEEVAEIITEKDSSNTLTKPLSGIFTSGAKTLTIPDFEYIFQRPSYILDSTKSGEYFCDSSRNECKINLKLINTQNKKDISSKFECEIGLSFESVESQKCNPNTIIFPIGKHKISFKISEKGNRGNFKEKIIWVHNNKELTESLQKETNNEITKSPPPILSLFQEKDVTAILPDFQYIFQRPSYILDSSENNKYFCDTSKEECKLNFKLVDGEDKDISSKFECEINFSTEDFSTINKIISCNPNTIIFPKGENKVVFKIFEKNNKTNFRKKTIFVNNDKNTNSAIAKPLSSVLTPSQEQGGNTIKINLKHSLPYTKIKVQGKITKSKIIKPTRMTCYTYSECSINFTSGKIYKSQREGINFYWDFGNSENYSGYNPKSVKFSPGNYNVRLIVTDNYGNKKTETYKVRVVNLYTKTEIKSLHSTAKNLGNFSIENLLFKNIEKYSPEKYQNINNYKQSLESIIYGDTILKWGTSKGTSQLVLTNSSLKPKENTPTIDQQKKLAKYIKLRVNFQKKNLKIHGETFPNSKIELSIGKQVFTTSSNNTGEYEIKINTLVSGNYKIQATVHNTSGEIIAQKYSSEKEITQGYIHQLNSYKKDTTTKTIKNLPSKNSKSTLEKTLAKNISLRVTLQKKNLKIYGTTFPNSKVILTIGKQQFTTLSDNTGKYQLKINSIEVGEYKIYASVYNLGKLVAKKSSSEKTFSNAYITKMRNYGLKKSSTSNITNSRTKKFTLENYAPHLPNFIPIIGFNIKVFVINMLIAILSLILLFVVLIKRKLI